MIIRNNITEVAYNVQTTVDEKYNLPIDYKVTNTNDSKAMGNMLRRAKSILRTNEFTALYDKGYHTGTEFKIANISMFYNKMFTDFFKVRLNRLIFDQILIKTNGF